MTTTVDEQVWAPVSLDEAFEAARRRRKLLVPYVTAGIRDDWVELAEACVAAGADAIEIGIPFSDPSLDGPTIQEASTLALARGMTPAAALDALSERRLGVPVIVMTYFNVAYRVGLERFAASLNRAGVTGTILPDLPFELSDEWRRIAEHHDVGHVQMTAPVTPSERIGRLADATHGFVYAVSMMGTTGERESLADGALDSVRRAKAVTDRPVLLGFGVSTPQHAEVVVPDADGVIVASALMRRVLEGANTDDAVALVADMRSAIDAVPLER